MNDPRLVRGAAALAERLGVHPRTIFKWRKQGLLDGSLVIDRPGYTVYNVAAAFNALAGKRLIKADKVGICDVLEADLRHPSVIRRSKP